MVNLTEGGGLPESGVSDFEHRGTSLMGDLFRGIFFQILTLTFRSVKLGNEAQQVAVPICQIGDQMDYSGQNTGEFCLFRSRPVTKCLGENVTMNYSGYLLVPSIRAGR